VNFMLSRKACVSIFPERIVFLRKPGSTKLIGEAILKCGNGWGKIEDISVQCEPSNDDEITCEVKNLDDRTGRVYFQLERNKFSTANDNTLRLLVNLNGGSKTEAVFLSSFIAN
jgi:hypothetical protein